MKPRGQRSGGLDDDLIAIFAELPWWSVPVAAAAVALLDTQSDVWSDGDKKAKQLLHLGQHAKKLRSYDRPARIGGQTDVQEESAETAG